MITVELEDGPKLTFQLDFGARIAVEDRLGRSFNDAAARAGSGWQGDLLAIMWAGLQRHHDFTEEQVMEMLDEHGAAMVAAMEKAAVAATPDAEPGEVGNRKARRASKASGRSGAKQG